MREHITPLLSIEQITGNTPSRRDGISHDIEDSLRIFGCEIIQHAGILLKLPMVVMARAQVLFHRFFMKQSMAKFDVYLISLSTLFLSAKIEEQSKSIDSFLIVFHRIYQRRNNLPLIPFDSFYLRDVVITVERLILIELGFRTHVEHPHKFLLFYLHVLDGNDEMANVAWNYLNDSLRTTLCLQMKPELIATGAIHLAARKLRIKLPHNPCWYTLFDATSEELKIIEDTIMSLYNRSEATYIDVIREPKSVDETVYKYMHSQRVSNISQSFATIPQSLPEEPRTSQSSEKKSRYSVASLKRQRGKEKKEKRRRRRSSSSSSSGGSSGSSSSGGGSDNKVRRRERRRSYSRSPPRKYHSKHRHSRYHGKDRSRSPYVRSRSRSKSPYRKRHKYKRK